MWIRAQTSQNLREWARDVLLRVVENESHAEIEMHLSSLSLSVSRCLMNALDPLLRGEKMTQEQLAPLYRRVQTTKAAQAHEHLAKRSLNKEK